MAVIRPLYIDKDEGVGSVITRIKNTGDKNIALVFPPESQIFSNVVEVKFLKDQLKGLKKEVIFITQDRNQEKLAESLGLKVKKDLEDNLQEGFLESFYQKKEEGKPEKAVSRTPQAEKTGEGVEKKERLKVSDIVTSQPKKRPRPESPKKEKPPLAERKSKKRFDFRIADWFSKFSLGGGVRRWVIGLLGLSFLVFVLCTTFVFPHAKVTVFPTKNTKKVSFTLTVDKDIASIDPEKDLIPAEIFSLKKEKSQQFQATGRKKVEKKAQGTIKIYNAYSSKPQTLVRTTRFVSEGGKLFRIPKTVVVPPAKVENGKITPTYVEAKVYADEPGAEYNIGPSRFTIPGFKGSPKYDGFYAVSEEPMTGGKAGEVSYVTEEDKENAVNKLKEGLLQEAKAELQKQIAKDLTIVDKALAAEIESSQTEPEVGQEAKKFTLTLKAQAQAFAFRPQYVEKLVQEKIKAQAPSDYTLVEDTLTINYKDPVLNFEKGKGTFKVEAKQDVAWEVKESKLKKMLAGKNEVQSRKAVTGFPEIKTLRVKLWPFWLRSIPSDESKINIEVKY